ncbi:MAG: hypothetical protein AAF634_08460 [Bacteroidota bacterium]
MGKSYENKTVFIWLPASDSKKTGTAVNDWEVQSAGKRDAVILHCHYYLRFGIRAVLKINNGTFKK